MATTPAKKTLKKAAHIPEGNAWRPIRVTINTTLPRKGGRRVTPADIDAAADAAAAAFRASLESRTPAYDVKDLNLGVEYLYIQHRSHTNILGDLR